MRKPANKALLALGSLLIFVLLESQTPAFSAEKEEFRFRTKSGVSEIKPKKPAKIGLKRHIDGRYSWEITGDSTEEIIKIDRRLKKAFTTAGEKVINGSSY